VPSDYRLPAARDTAFDQHPLSRGVDRRENLSMLIQPIDVAARPGSEFRPPNRTAEANLAKGSLRQTVAAGYRNAAAIRSDPSFDPIQSRPDDPLLMTDPAFPADPLAGNE
jgi:hypothetical protein